MTIEIYTDGACMPNPGTGGWAFILFEHGVKVLERSGAERRTTNNRMEMLAIIRAMQYTGEELPGVRPTILTDSKLCMNTLNFWAESWARRGWRKADGGEVANLDLVKEAYSLFRQVRPRVVWVRGHGSNTGNIMADRLATEARIKLAGPDRPRQPYVPRWVTEDMLTPDVGDRH